MKKIRDAGFTRTADAVAKYRLEPYVVAADVYALPPHTGRGGWSWYTGSAGWMYRLIVESLLGVELATDRLRIAPCLPAGWNSFKLDYRFRETLYRITVTRASSADRELGVWLDGERQPDGAIPLAEDRIDHVVDVVVHPRPPEAPG